LKYHRLFAVLLLFVVLPTLGQGVGIPSKKGGIGFGNLKRFTGIRLNFIDRGLEKVTGINVAMWKPKRDSAGSGTINGVAIGLPISTGAGNIHGISAGIFGVGAGQSMHGINVGGLGIGAGEDLTGINIGGLGAGSGGNLNGFTFGGLGAGAGGNVNGISIGGLGIGAGGDLTGINLGGLGVGAGENVKGFSFGGLGMGAGENITGVSIGGLGVGAGKNITGISISVLAVGSGESVNGIAIAGLATGSPVIRALAIAPFVGGKDLKGIFIAPLSLQMGSKEMDEETVIMKGISVSAFNKVRGHQRGLTIGALNYATHQHGLQLGILNYVKDNPKGLRWLPLFNMHFGKKPVITEQN
jgi:hypothetical protein